MKFGEMTSVSGIAFYASELSGILGLAYESISQDQVPTFLDSSDAATKDFAFYLKNNPEESYMTLPGIDPSVMSMDTLQFHNVVEKKYWSLKFTQIRQGINPISFPDGLKAVIDSGTSAIVADENIVNALIEGIEVA